MKLLVDMGLSPRWCAAMEKEGFPTVHWCTVGGSRVSDATLLRWAQENDRVVLTCDLDAGAILAATRASGRSVVQCRAQDVMPEALGPLVAGALRRHEEILAQGAILVLDAGAGSARILPLAR